MCRRSAAVIIGTSALRASRVSTSCAISLPGRGEESEAAEEEAQAFGVIDADREKENKGRFTYQRFQLHLGR